MPTLALALALSLLRAPAEVIDRIAARVDRSVITLSEVRNQVRVAALLNGEDLDLSESKCRQAVERLIELALIQREMELSRYPLPSPAEVQPLLEKIRQERRGEGRSWHDQLIRYGLSEEDLRDSLLLQVTILRFIDYRFRPGITVADREVEQYYQESFVPSWKRTHAGPPPSLEDTRAEIEEILTAARVNEALDRWLKEARAAARVQLYEEAFQ